MTRRKTGYGPKGDYGDRSVFTKYMGQPIGNSQEPDDPHDPYTDRHDGMKISGMGSVSGGSKPTPQAARMTTGSGSRSSRISIGSSIPRNTQKLRG